MTGPFGRAMRLGAVLWLVATLAIRLAGQWVLRPEATFLLADFVIGGAAMALLGPRLRLRISADARDAYAVALGLILPGMLADAVVTLGFRHVYPNLSPLLGDAFGALMLWYYAVAALAITLRVWRDGGRDAGADDGGPGGDRRRDHDQGVARAA